jgi:hypothetical protein
LERRKYVVDNIFIRNPEISEAVIRPDSCGRYWVYKQNDTNTIFENVPVSKDFGELRYTALPCKFIKINHDCFDIEKVSLG